jgi:hypothetical protein
MKISEAVVTGLLDLLAWPFIYFDLCLISLLDEFDLSFILFTTTSPARQLHFIRRAYQLILSFLFIPT